MLITLTIAIPTFNRANLLDKCLLLLAKDFTANQAVEIIVSNNASTDNTALIAKKHRESNFPELRYFENSTNLGPDLNIAQCFKEARGKYVWIFSDDDLLAPTYGSALFKLLEEGNWGLVHLKSEWYSGDVVPSPQPEDLSYDVFVNNLKFLEEVNYWVTFITGNIVNKSLLLNSEVTYAFDGTYLIQLGWILPAMFAGQSNVLVNTKVLLCRADNSGGYNFYKIFSVNFNNIIKQLIKGRVIDKESLDIINKHLLRSYFPMFAGKNMVQYKKEKLINVMLPVYWSKPLFWKNIVFKTFLSRTKYFAKKIIRK